MYAVFSSVSSWQKYKLEFYSAVNSLRVYDFVNILHSLLVMDLDTNSTAGNAKSLTTRCSPKSTSNVQSLHRIPLNYFEVPQNWRKVWGAIWTHPRKYTATASNKFKVWTLKLRWWGKLATELCISHNGHVPHTGSVFSIFKEHKFFFLIVQGKASPIKLFFYTRTSQVVLQLLGDHSQ
jgi:hypothetical protein